MSFDLHTFCGPTMATTYHISFYGDADGAELQRQVQTELDIIEQEMSNWRATSDIMRLNQAPIG
ncbi:MAG: FAD:protein FMN transferase, partial [Paracoccaceae bacterium]